MGFGGIGIMRILGFWEVEIWDSEKVGFQESGKVAFWEIGILGKWYFGKVGFGKGGPLGKLDFIKM